MKNILMKDAISRIEKAINEVEGTRTEANAMRFDDTKTKDDMADKMNNIGKHDGALKEIKRSLKGIEELLEMQKVMERY